MKSLIIILDYILTDDNKSPQSNGTTSSKFSEESTAKTEEADQSCKVSESVTNGEVSEDQSKDTNNDSEVKVSTNNNFY